MLIGVGGVWLAWLAGWINRVELRMRAEAAVAALGLAFEREGVLPRVEAAGNVGGTAVRVRWRVGWWGHAVDTQVKGGPWSELPEGADVARWVMAELGAGEAGGPQTNPGAPGAASRPPPDLPPSGGGEG